MASYSLYGYTYNVGYGVRIISMIDLKPIIEIFTVESYLLAP